MMKALTIYQPWASLIALGEKRIETRGWATNYRGPIAIHAGKKPFNTDSYFDRELYPFADALGLHDIFSFDALPYGGILAICNLVDCKFIAGFVENESAELVGALLDGKDGFEKVVGNEYAFGDYTPGRYAWILEDVHQLAEPIPARGRQRIWNWDETEHQVMIDPWVVGKTRIWTPEGVRSGKLITKPNDDAVMGLEVA